jgi:hypothetical protein
LPAAIADPAGADMKVVFVARHQTTIGSRTSSRKTRNAVACCNVELPALAKILRSPICCMSRATALGALRENDNRKKRRSLVSTERWRLI